VLFSLLIDANPFEGEVSTGSEMWLDGAGEEDRVSHFEE
jgi:hypothetical protein